MNKRYFIRKFKGLFFRLNLHLFVPSKMLSFISYLAQLSRWIKNHRQIGFSDFYSSKFNYAKRYDLYKHVIAGERLNEGIDYLEFGVAKGESIKWWAKNITVANARFYGFDTFSGLPEDWGLFKKGDMNNNNEPPKTDDRRCVFYQGLFQQTLPGFLAGYEPERRKVIHMDADLYTSTYYVLTTLSPVLKAGDIIFFDEFNVPMHEFKAFTEWVDSYYINYRVLGSVNNFYQIAVILV